jgi:hypothetical protein
MTTPDVISPDLKTVLRRPKLSRRVDTLPERLTLARSGKTLPLVARSSPFGRLGQAHHCRGRVEAHHSLLVVETCRRRRQQ